MAGMSPAGPTRCGSTTCSTKPEATQASKALPPFSSMDMPAADASQWVEVTMPKVPRISGLVVNMMSYPKLASLLLFAGVERVAQAIAEEVEAENDQEDRGAREDRHPG